MTISFVNTEGDTEKQNMYVYSSSQNFVEPLSFCKDTITVNKQINQLIPDTCKEEKHISIIISEKIINFCHRLG